MCFSSAKMPETKTAAPAPTAVTSADVSVDSKRQAANASRRKSGFADTIVSGSTAAALTQQATDSMKKTLG